MTRKKPRSGWRRAPAAHVRTEHVYTPEFLDALCEKFDIADPEIRVRLGRRAEYAAREYVSLNANLDHRPRPAEVIAALDALKETATRLLTQFETLDDETWRHLSRAVSELENEAFIPGKSALEDIGALCWINEGRTEAEYLTLDDIPVALRLACLYAERARQSVPPATSGPRKQIALRRWVGLIADFWIDDLGRPLTYDALDGKGFTDAYVFFEALLSELDPKAVPLLGSILAEERTRRRN